jgi:YnfA/UPF0060 family uncharacterized protein
MERLLIIGGLFVVAGLCEIGGGYLVWGWMRDHKPLAWALLGAAVPCSPRSCGSSSTHPRVRAGLRRLRRGVHRAGLGVGCGRRRVQAGPIRSPRCRDLRGGRGDGRPASGVRLRLFTRARGR